MADKPTPDENQLDFWEAIHRIHVNTHKIPPRFLGMIIFVLGLSCLLNIYPSFILSGLVTAAGMIEVLEAK
jgi:hypothetical protein